MRQEWERLFMEMKEPREGTFQLTSGETVRTKFLDSGLEKYLHAKTEEFEAVVLPCDRVEMILILPRSGLSVAELERSLAAGPSVLDQGFKSELGSVSLPVFEIRSKFDLVAALKDMGVREVFSRLDGIFREEWNGTGKDTRPRAHVTEIRQDIDFAADKHGIRADAETIVGAIPAGIIVSPDAFHLSLDRPFVFLVRDHPTGALLFAGALMNPNRP
jgi:serpin B